VKSGRSVVVTRIHAFGAPKSQTMNALLQKYFGSLKSDCLDRMIIFFGKRSLERAVTEYVEHYHVARNHQGLVNELVEPSTEVDSIAGQIVCRERPGGMLKYYHRRTA
jgi:putative transposase